MKEYLYNLVFFPLPIIWFMFFIMLFKLKKYSYFFLKIIFLFIFIISMPIFTHIVEYPLKANSNSYLEGNNVSIVLVPTAGSYKDYNNNWHPSSTSIQRAVMGEAVAKKLNTTLVISGGDLHESGISEAFLVSKMINQNAILDNTSKNTSDTAINLKYIIEENNLIMDYPILLVTSPIHNLRTSMTLRSYGYKVKIFNEKLNTKYSIIDFIPNSKSFTYLNNALYEYIGILKYILSGHIKLNSVL